MWKIFINRFSKQYNDTDIILVQGLYTEIEMNWYKACTQYYTKLDWCKACTQY